MTVKQEPVSVNWQTLFAVLPVVWIWAFYRIEKLRLGLLLLIGVSYGIPFLVMFSVMGLSQGVIGPEWGYILLIVLQIVIPIRFIRKWSKQWNEKFS